MKSFALNTDVSSDSETTLNSIVFSSKKYVLTPNIDFSLPHHYYCWEAWGRFSDCDDLVLIYNEACNLKEQTQTP